MNGYGNVLKLKNVGIGITPTLSTFANNPSNPNYATDGNETTVTGAGDKTFAAASGDIGVFELDLGSVKKVLISGTYGIWVSGSNIACTSYWDFKKASGDSYTTHPSNDSVTRTSSEPTILREMPVGVVYARYIRLRGTTNSSYTGTVYMKVGTIRPLEV